MTPRSQPLLVAIAGGSGSGKTWLAARLAEALPRRTARLALDDFYRDHAHLPPARRCRVNFDDPRAIDWPCLERVRAGGRAGRAVEVPVYDFATHTRRPHARRLAPKPLLLVEGLWRWRRRALRPLFALRIFIECPARVRLARRLARDLRERGRTRASILRQFRRTVEPMHRRYVAPQAHGADVVLTEGFGRREVGQLAEQLRQQLNMLRSKGR